MKTEMRRNKLVRRIKKLLSSSVCWPVTPHHQAHVDVCEEYANAFRTKSYMEFWTRVVAYSNGECRSCLSRESTSSMRLPSYRLFAEHFLDPNQSTVTQILAQTKLQPDINSLLSDYFSYTADASILCSHLLKDIDSVRVKYKSLKTILQCVPTNQIPSSVVVTHFKINSSESSYPESIPSKSKINGFLSEFSNSLNPFAPSSPSSCRVRDIMCRCSELQKRLESNRDKMRVRLKMIGRVKYGSTCVIVITLVSFLMFVITHGFALLIAMPGLAFMNLTLEKKLTKVITQLDAAAKGTYILSKDLETTSRLVARLNDELEHMRTTIKFCFERKKYIIQADVEVVDLLNKSQCNFSDQLDELEEHLYLCFMTINRARDLVLNQITTL